MTQWCKIDYHFLSSSQTESLLAGLCQYRSINLVRDEALNTVLRFYSDLFPFKTGTDLLSSSIQRWSYFCSSGQNVAFHALDMFWFPAVILHLGTSSLHTNTTTEFARTQIATSMNLLHFGYELFLAIPSA